MRLGPIYNHTKFHDDISTNKKVKTIIRWSSWWGCHQPFFLIYYSPGVCFFLTAALIVKGVSYRVSDLARSVMSSVHSLVTCQLSSLLLMMMMIIIIIIIIISISSCSSSIFMSFKYAYYYFYYYIY